MSGDGAGVIIERPSELKAPQSLPRVEQVGESLPAAPPSTSVQSSAAGETQASDPIGDGDDKSAGERSAGDGGEGAREKENGAESPGTALGGALPETREP